jgi:hypothetical protein
MGCVVGRPPCSVDIIPDSRGVFGRTDFPTDVTESIKRYFDQSPQKKRYIRQRVLTALAGTMAHNLLI